MEDQTAPVQTAAVNSTSSKSFSDEKHAADPHPHAAPHDLLDAVEAGTVDSTAGPLSWAQKLEAKLGIEARGLERVPESQRARKDTLADYVQMALIWFSSNLTVNNMALGLLGPTSFYLGLKDAMIIGVFGVIAGSIGTAYISTFGPLSGNRTLVNARYTMGWWPSKICAALNIVIMLGYGLVDCLLAGQMLSAIAGGGMTVIVGTIVASLISLVVAMFGIKLFHIYERYAFIPQILIIFILIGSAGPKFNATSQSTGGSEVVVADRVSFFFLAASGPLAWSPAACDFYVYFPPTASRTKVFFSTLIGLSLGTLIALVIGVGLSSGALVDESWAAAYEISAGALVREAMLPLGAFGDFCSVILALGLVGNNVPGLYSTALSFQTMGRWFRYLPRVVWVVIGTVIYTVLACIGRDSFFEIFEDFLALMGYWTIMWVTMTLEEELIFRKGRHGYNWEDWDTPSALPLGIAALVAFCIGWVGAVLSMWQIYFTGPIASLVGDGIDLGFPVSMSWVAIVYPPLRYLELKMFRR